MLGRVAVVGIPVLAVGVTALVLWGPGRARPAVGARVWGVPVEGSTTLALRIQTSRRFYGIDDDIPLDGLTVELPGIASEPWRGATGPDGIAEVAIPCGEALQGAVPVRVGRGREVVLDGEIAFGPQRSVRPERLVLNGVREGALTIDVDVPRGHLVSPFATDLRIRVHRDGTPVGAAITARAPGADLQPERVETGDDGEARIVIEALALALELEIVATREGERGPERGRWEGTLPLEHGAVSLDPIEADWHPGGGRLHLHLRTARTEGSVYGSLIGDRGRLSGFSVPLTEEAGFGVGAIAVETPTDAKWLAVIVGTDPLEQSESTVAWPIDPPEGVPRVDRLELLVDGMPQAEQRERARGWLAKRSAILVVAAAALAEVLLLVYRSRQAQRALNKHLTQAAGTGEADALTPEDRDKLLGAGNQVGGLLVGLFVALVVLAFSIVATLSLFR